MYIGLLATTPTDQPSMRASAQHTLRAYSGCSSNTEPGSHTLRHDAAHVVAARALGRHQVGEPVVGHDRFRRLPARRPLAGVAGEVGQPAADGGVRLLVVVHAEVDLARAAGVDVDAAHLLEGDDLPGGHLEDRGDVTARHEPRVITTKSDRADRNDDPPNDWPTMAVAIGTWWWRAAMVKRPPTSEMPSEPMVSGMRAPPVWPKCTIGLPMARARS